MSRPTEKKHDPEHEERINRIMTAMNVTTLTALSKKLNRPQPRLSEAKKTGFDLLPRAIIDALLNEIDELKKKKDN